MVTYAHLQTAYGPQRAYLLARAYYRTGQLDYRDRNLITQPAKLSLQLIAEMPDALALALTRDPEFNRHSRSMEPHQARDILLQRYVAMDRLEPPADALFKKMFKYADGWIRPQVVPDASEVAVLEKPIRQTVDALTGERLAVYIVMRLGLHLRQAIEQTQPGLLDDVLPPTIGTTQVLVPPTITAGLREQSGLGFLIQLAMTSPLATLVFLSPAPGDVLDTVSRAYVAMHNYFAYARRLAAQAITREYGAGIYPGTMLPGTGADLVGMVLRVLLARSPRIQLGTSVAAYMAYVTRILLNYQRYGVAGLRHSDLNQRDPIFSAAQGNPLPTLCRVGLSKTYVTDSLINSFLVQPPTDAQVLRRLDRL